MIPIGFTGTRENLTRRQELALRGWMMTIGEAELHHGSCVGADASAHAWARHLNWRIVTHPGIVPPHLRANHRDYDEQRDPKPPRDRNADIVRETALLVACPNGIEQLRSGTWSTVRLARRLGRPRTIIWPNGQIEVEP